MKCTSQPVQVKILKKMKNTNMANISDSNLTTIIGNHSESSDRMSEDVLYHCSSSYLAMVSLIGVLLNTKAICILASVMKVKFNINTDE